MFSVFLVKREHEEWMYAEVASLCLWCQDNLFWDNLSQLKNSLRGHVSDSHFSLGSHKNNFATKEKENSFKTGHCMFAGTREEKLATKSRK